MVVWVVLLVLGGQPHLDIGLAEAHHLERLVLLDQLLVVRLLFVVL